MSVICRVFLWQPLEKLLFFRTPDATDQINHVNLSVIMKLVLEGNADLSDVSIAKRSARVGMLKNISQKIDTSRELIKSIMSTCLSL